MRPGFHPVYFYADHDSDASIHSPNMSDWEDYASSSDEEPVSEHSLPVSSPSSALASSASRPISTVSAVTAVSVDPLPELASVTTQQLSVRRSPPPTWPSPTPTDLPSKAVEDNVDSAALEPESLVDFLLRNHPRFSKTPKSSPQFPLARINHDSLPSGDFMMSKRALKYSSPNGYLQILDFRTLSPPPNFSPQAPVVFFTLI